MSLAAGTLDGLHGRINDLDSHLQIPASRWGQVFGEVGAQLGERFTGKPFFDDTDVPPLDRTSVWTTKGTSAPGAASPAERLAALQVMGIDRQLVLPQVVLASMAWQRDGHASAIRRAYNDAAIGWASQGGGRLYPAALLSPHNLDDAVAEAERVIAAGLRAVLVQDGVPTAGQSPAAKEADLLWSVLAESGVAVLLHLGGQKGFLGTEVWSDADTLRAGGPGSGELFSPYGLGTMHLSPQHYLTTMIFGGVFERHPALRFGVIEMGAYWIGPLADFLDHRAEQSTRLRASLSLKPSETLARNVRVTPYYWEPIARQIQRYGIPEVYAFSTDFPHTEGGTDPIERFYDEIAPLGDEIVEQFFVTNGELILPA